MNLVIFDLDGTLTRTVAIDASCYVRVFEDVFNIPDINAHWDEYTHYTDSGIADQIFREKMGRPLSPDENSRLIKRFVEMLKEAERANPELFTVMPGAAAMIERLKSESNWKAAIATGCWEASARFKLKKAGLKPKDIPLVSSDESMVREEIVKTAIKKAGEYHRTDQFDKIVYIGDGVWDVRTTRTLNLPFIGIGNDERIKSLYYQGARNFLPDFNDYDELLKQLNEATVPVEIGE